MNIHHAAFSDREEIRAIHLKSFTSDENVQVAELAVELLSAPEAINLMATVDDSAAGHIAFSPVTLSGSNQLVGYILAPLAVLPEYQKRGIGGRLIASGLEQLAKQKIPLVFVYGDPDYYGRFGFRAELAKNFSPPYPLKFPHGWLALEPDGSPGGHAGGAIECVAALSKPELW